MTNKIKALLKISREELIWSIILGIAIGLVAGFSNWGLVYFLGIGIGA